MFGFFLGGVRLDRGSQRPPGPLHRGAGVVALSGNGLLDALFDAFLVPLRTALIDLVDLLAQEAPLPDTSRDHDELLGALRNRDPEHAVRATIGDAKTTPSFGRAGADRGFVAESRRLKVVSAADERPAVHNTS